MNFFNINKFIHFNFDVHLKREKTEYHTPNRYRGLKKAEKRRFVFRVSEGGGVIKGTNIKNRQKEDL